MFSAAINTPPDLTHTLSAQTVKAPNRASKKRAHTRNLPFTPCSSSPGPAWRFSPLFLLFPCLIAERIKKEKEEKERKDVICLCASAARHMSKQRTCFFSFRLFRDRQYGHAWGNLKTDLRKQRHLLTVVCPTTQLSFTTIIQC